MKYLTLQRLETSDLGTFGKLTGEGLALATAELPWRDNKKNVSCIPPGEYAVRLEHSPKFGPNTYELQNVPGRSDVLIHKGNWAGDTTKGHLSNVEGCILLGLLIGPVLHEKSGVRQKGVLSSGAAMDRLHAALKGEPFKLQVIDIPSTSATQSDMV